MPEHRKKHSQRKRNRVEKGRTPQKPRIALIGFRGVGKSAIARRLAEKWQMPLLSLDEKIEKEEGRRIDQIVVEHGWQYFRDKEANALEEASKSEKLLLDCGGGIVEEANGTKSERKIKLLQENFFCIYLFLSEEKLLSRLKNLSHNASRPQLSSADSPEKLLEVFKRREPLYLSVADALVDISDTNIQESALRIMQLFR